MNYLFPDITLPLGDSLRIEMSRQDRSTHAAPAWSSPTSPTVSPWTEISPLTKRMEPEIGAFGADQMSFTAMNLDLGSGVRMSDLLTASSPLDYTWHVRVSHRPTALGSWSYIFWGVVVTEDVQIIQPDDSDDSTWTVRFTAVDSIMQLEDIEVNAAFFSTYLDPSTYDYNPNAVYICYDNSGGAREELTGTIFHHDGANFAALTPAGLRFIKIVDALQAISDAIGVTTTINNSAGVDCAWEFKIFDGSNDVAVTFDDLYFVGGIYSGATRLWHYTFTDIEQKSPASWYNCGTLMDLLKEIIVPFGLVASIQFTAAGARYLQIEEIQDDNGVSFSGSNVVTPITEKPADRLLYGLRVRTVEAADYTIGSVGDGATALQNRWLSANRLPGGWKWSDTDDLAGLYRSIYALDGTDMHSVYKIDVQSDGLTGTWGADVTAGTDQATGGLVVSEACAKYYYNPTSDMTTEPVGIYRRMMRQQEISVHGVYAGSPALRQYHTLNGINWWVRGIEVDYVNGVTKYTCETGDW